MKAKHFRSVTIAVAGALASASLEPIGVKQLWHEFLAGMPGVRYTDVLCLVHLLRWVQLHGLTAGDAVPAPVREALVG